MESGFLYEAARVIKEIKNRIVTGWSVEGVSEPCREGFEPPVAKGQPRGCGVIVGRFVGERNENPRMTLSDH